MFDTNLKHRDSCLPISYQHPDQPPGAFKCSATGGILGEESWCVALEVYSAELLGGHLAPKLGPPSDNQILHQLLIHKQLQLTAVMSTFGRFGICRLSFTALKSSSPRPPSIACMLSQNSSEATHT